MLEENEHAQQDNGTFFLLLPGFPQPRGFPSGSGRAGEFAFKNPRGGDSKNPPPVASLPNHFCMGASVGPRNKNNCESRVLAIS